MTKLTATQIEEAASLTARKMKNVVAHFGHAIDADDWAAIRAIRAERDAPMKAEIARLNESAAARAKDPAEIAAREARAAAFEKDMQEATAARRAAIKALPTFSLWSKDRRSAALARAYLPSLADNSYVDLAILDLIARHARKLGWSVKRSTGRDGRKSTVYVTPKGLAKVRVSDHTLPQTHTRQLRESMGVRGGWAGEVIISDVIGCALEEIIEEILTIARED